MSYYEDEDVDIQVITPPRKTENESDVVSNVFYGKKTKANAQKVKNNEEQFYKWVKSLNPEMNRDVKSETHNFSYQHYTVDDKNKKTVH